MEDFVSSIAGALPLHSPQGFHFATQVRPRPKQEGDFRIRDSRRTALLRLPNILCWRRDFEEVLHRRSEQLVDVL